MDKARSENPGRESLHGHGADNTTTQRDQILNQNSLCQNGYGLFAKPLFMVKDVMTCGASFNNKW